MMLNVSKVLFYNILKNKETNILNIAIVLVFRANEIPNEVKDLIKKYFFFYQNKQWILV